MDPDTTGITAVEAGLRTATWMYLYRKASGRLPALDELNIRVLYSIGPT